MRVTRRLRCYGIVQGVGMRPTVDRHAHAAGVAGSVCNKGPYVEIFAQGEPGRVEEFCRLVRERPPRRADVVKVEVTDVPAAEAPSFAGFSIKESERTEGAIFVSPDIAVCDDCKRELFDPADRRYLHPFINCTCCGPRLTIPRSLPYDRERTSMGAFPMCDDCAREYSDPASRRYDAQPICCNECGPEVYLLDRPERGAAAITEARRCIASGGIVAVKGIGGFHLCCDATSEEAVSRLRRRKRRPAKPFAVMAADEAAAARECALDAARLEVLCGHQKPIVLARRTEGSTLAPSVAPDNPKVGLMLPYAPLQLLLFSYPDGVRVPDVLVMTSANVSGAPICRSDEDVRRDLAGLADLVLSHDRQILTRADDSVCDFFAGEPYMVRRSRGYAPLPQVVSALAEPAGGRGAGVVAVGGELKNCFCVGAGDLLYPSAYVGDLSDLRGVRALEEGVRRMEDLLEVEPEVVAVDLHPRYNSRAVGERLARETGVPLVGVQHHYAHVVSCMAENDHADPVVGVSFDGTGFGTDGTVWGGELLLCDYHGFVRAGHVDPFVQAGGDAASREGWRCAVGVLAAAAGGAGTEKDAGPQGTSAPAARGASAEPDVVALAVGLGLADEAHARAQAAMVARRMNAVGSTSAGRLFDAASAILGVRTSSTFEGEASCALQFAAERHAEAAGARLEAAEPEGAGSAADAAGATGAGSSAGRPLEEVAAEAARGLAPAGGRLREEGGQVVLATNALCSRLAEARLAGEDPGRLALGFHHELALMVAEACRRLADETGIGTVALSGGCFQNTLLLALTKRLLEDRGLAVLVHGLIPPNDGGIALGQAVVAAQHLRDEAAGDEVGRYRGPLGRSLAAAAAEAGTNGAAAVEAEVRGT